MTQRSGHETAYRIDKGRESYHTTARTRPQKNKGANNKGDAGLVYVCAQCGKRQHVKDVGGNIRSNSARIRVDSYRTTTGGES